MRHRHILHRANGHWNFEVRQTPLVKACRIFNHVLSKFPTRSLFEFWGLLSGVTEDAVLRGNVASSMGEGISTFQGYYIVSKRRNPVAHWRNVISQKNGVLAPKFSCYIKCAYGWYCLLNSDTLDTNYIFLLTVLFHLPQFVFQMSPLHSWFEEPQSLTDTFTPPPPSYLVTNRGKCILTSFLRPPNTAQLWHSIKLTEITDITLNYFPSFFESPEWKYCANFIHAPI